MNHPPRVTVSMAPGKAKALSDALSDILCWCRGYMAGQDDTSKHPLDTLGELNYFNLNLVDATNEQEKAQ